MKSPEEIVWWHPYFAKQSEYVDWPTLRDDAAWTLARGVRPASPNGYWRSQNIHSQVLGIDEVVLLDKTQQAQIAAATGRKIHSLPLPRGRGAPRDARAAVRNLTVYALKSIRLRRNDALLCLRRWAGVYVDTEGKMIGPDGWLALVNGGDDEKTYRRWIAEGKRLVGLFESGQ